MKTFLLSVLILSVSISGYAATVYYFESASTVGVSSTSIVSPPPSITPDTPLSCPPGQAIFTGTNGSYCQ